MSWLDSIHGYIVVGVAGAAIIGVFLVLSKRLHDLETLISQLTTTIDDQKIALDTQSEILTEFKNNLTDIHAREVDRADSLHDDLQQSQKTLAEERERLRTLIDALPDLIYIKDTEHRFLLANTALVKYLGLESCDELIGKSDFELTKPKLAARYYKDERSVLESGEPLIDRVEPGFDLGKQTQQWFLSSKLPFYDQQGQIKGLLGIGRNITEREQEKEALKSLIVDLTWENLSLDEKLHESLPEETT